MSVAARRERERQERRAGIIDAAREVFLERGLDGATMDDIAQAAELSKGALYLHFGSKDELYVEVLQQTLGAIVDAARTAMEEAPDGLSAIRALMQAHYALAARDPEHFRLALSWMLKRAPIDFDCDSARRFAERVASIRRLLLDALERGKTDGSIRADLAGPVGLNLMAGLFGNELFYFHHRDQAVHAVGIDFDTMVPGYIDLITRALAADGARGGRP